MFAGSLRLVTSNRVLSVWAQTVCFIELHPITDAAEIAAKGGKTFKAVIAERTLGYFESNSLAQNWWASNREIIVAGKAGSFDPSDLAIHLDGTTYPSAKAIIVSRYLQNWQEEATAAGRTVRIGQAATIDGGFVWYGPARVGEAPISATGRPIRSAVYVAPDGVVYNLTVEGLIPVQRAGKPFQIEIDLTLGAALELK